MSLQEKFEKLQADLANVDQDNIGNLPLPLKAVACIIVVVVVVVLSYQGVLKNEKVRLDGEASKEVTLRTEFEKKVQDAANLEAYRQQMVEMTETFSTLLAQLPKDTEVPGLLDDISDKGSSSGLNFDAIDLQQEKNAEFYVELPINIRVKGGYHDFGTFVSGVAGLPRIVTLHDFVIQFASAASKAGSAKKAAGGAVAAGKSKSPPEKQEKKEEETRARRTSDELSMTITAKTYRYKSAEEVAVKTDDKKKAPAKKSSSKAAAKGDEK